MRNHFVLKKLFPPTKVVPEKEFLFPNIPFFFLIKIVTALTNSALPVSLNYHDCTKFNIKKQIKEIRAHGTLDFSGSPLGSRSCISDRCQLMLGSFDFCSGLARICRAIQAIYHRFYFLWLSSYDSSLTSLP